MTHPRYCIRVLGAQASDTYYTDLYDVGWPDAPGRSLRNTTVDTWEAAGRPKSGERPGEGEAVVSVGEAGQVLRYEPVAARRDYEGDIEALPLWAGQGVGLVHKRQPAADIVAEIMAEANAAVEDLSRL